MFDYSAIKFALHNAQSASRDAAQVCIRYGYFLYRIVVPAQPLREQLGSLIVDVCRQYAKSHGWQRQLGIARTVRSVGA